MSLTLTRYALYVVCATVITLTLLTFVVMARRYVPHEMPALVQPNCTAPCFMGIRPGWTNMRDAYWVLAYHEWVANRPEEFPSLVRESSLIGAGIPRTIMRWRWSAEHPVWIDGTVPGAITLQDRDVLNITVETRLALGAVMLALGEPDEWRYVSTGQGYGYVAWYAAAGLFIQAEAVCPLWRRYHRPVRMLVSPQRPIMPDSIPPEVACR